MGIIRTALRLLNDRAPELGEVDANALVDTGAMNLCIPARVAARLKLEPLYEREVILADGGRRRVPYCGGVRVELKGRGCVTGALVFGEEVLLGAIPMEDMDLVVHPARLEVLPNPDSPNIAVSLAMSARPR